MKLLQLLGVIVGGVLGWLAAGVLASEAQTVGIDSFALRRLAITAVIGIAAGAAVGRFIVAPLVRRLLGKGR